MQLKVVEAEVIFNDRGSKGFAFITMKNASEAEAAKKAIHMKEFSGRIVEVNPATARHSSRQKNTVVNAKFPARQPDLHLQLALLQQQNTLPLAAPAADPQMALQQYLAAQAIVAQYTAQQQMLQGLQPMQQLQLQPQHWMLQQQQLMQPTAPSQLDLDKHQRRLTEELGKQQRYRPY